MEQNAALFVEAMNCAGYAGDGSNAVSGGNCDIKLVSLNIFLHSLCFKRL